MNKEIETKQVTQNIILMISGRCCFPNMASLDNQAQLIIEQALEETGVSAIVKMVTATGALQGAVPAEIMQELGPNIQTANLMRLPAILINGKLQFWGIPDLNELKTILNNLKEGLNQ